MIDAAPTASSMPTGLVYADVPNRAIAYIIDAIVIGILGAIVGAVLGVFGLQVLTIDDALNVSYNYLASVVYALISLAISGAYFIYTWTSMRSTLGMKVLGMQIGNSADGKTLTMDQAVRRFIALGAPFTLAQVLNPLPLIGLLIGLAAFGWVIFLLYSTSQSPTKQGWHDVFANTMVVKAAKSVA
ncbi:MAG: RDD family protein [Candidatus Limnocylindrales bacterium]